MKKVLIYKIQGKDIEVFLTVKNIKNMWMKINSKNQIVVSAPKRVPEDIINKFILRNINSFIEKINQKNRNSHINIEENFFYSFGEKIYFNLDHDNQKIKIRNHSFSFKNKEIKTIVENYLKKELIAYLEEEQPKWEEKMNIPNHKIAVRKKITAWATNHVRNKKIFYAMNLVAFSKEIINYVVIHELSHHIYQNHSVSFWSNVALYEPNYKELRFKLKKYQYI